MDEGLIHDVAVAISRQVVEVVAPCLREEEQRDAFEEIFDRVKAGIECYELRRNRSASRLHPGNN